MGDILLDDGGRDLTPWYRTRDLVGNNTYPGGGPVPAADLYDGWTDDVSIDPLLTDFAIVRWLPEDTYLPVQDVIATITAALHWGRAVNVSWMEMQYRSTRDSEVPVQEHRNGAAIFYVDDNLEGFGVAGPEDLDGAVRVAMNCVTDIHLVNLVPHPDPVGSRADDEKMARLLGLGTSQEYDYVARLRRDGDEHWREVADHVIDSVVNGYRPRTSGHLLPQVDG